MERHALNRTRNTKNAIRKAVTCSYTHEYARTLKPGPSPSAILCLSSCLFVCLCLCVRVRVRALAWVCECLNGLVCVSICVRVGVGGCVGPCICCVCVWACVRVPVHAWLLNYATLPPSEYVRLPSVVWECLQCVCQSAGVYARARVCVIVDSWPHVWTIHSMLHWLQEKVQSQEVSVQQLTNPTYTFEHSGALRVDCPNPETVSQRSDRWTRRG